MSIRVCCASIPLAAEYSPFSIEALPEGISGLRDAVGASLGRPLRCSPAVCDPRYVPPRYRREVTVLEPPAPAAAKAYWPVALPTELAARPSSVSIDWIARWVVS